MNHKETYLLLRQYAAQPAQVLLIDTLNARETVLFSGGRWDARRALVDFIVQYEGVPAFCQKKSGNLVSFN